MQILNRYYVKTKGFNSTWGLCVSVASVIVSLVGATLVFNGMTASGFWWLFASNILNILHMALYEWGPKDDEVEVLECIFSSEEEIEKALDEYTLVQRRGYIYVLTKKEEVVE